MDATELHELSSLLKALGEYNRLSMVFELCQCQSPRNAMCLCECCSVDASVASRHLKVLTQEGVVRVEKKGRERAYSLNRSAIANKLRKLADQIDRSAISAESATETPVVGNDNLVERA